jgi:cytochrome c oxidase cbb3-type subunit 3/ubiquinol-cytochrome c reductase cytochrome c subunit
MLCCCVTLVGCGQLPGKPKPGPEVPRPEQVMDFPTLYSQNCSGCHGAEGKNGPSYPLANPVYEALVDEQQLKQVIANGDAGTLMPAFAASAGGTLTDEQIDALVKGMRGAWYKPNALQGATPPPYKAAKAGDPSHGAQVYTTYCASCHGATGQTAKSKAGSVTDPAFVALVSDQVLRTVIIAGRPDIGQPDWRNDLPGHPMSDGEVTDVVAWLKKGGGTPQ